MAYEIISDTETEEQIIPAGKRKGRWRKTYDLGFVEGQVMKFRGLLDGSGKDLSQYTVTEIPEGQKMVVLVDIRFELQNIEE